MAGYDSHPAGDAMELSTTPEPVPQPWLLVAIPGGLLVLIARAESIVWGIVAAGFVYGAMYLLTHSKQATQYRTPARFRVSPSGVEINGTTIPKDAIHRIIVRNHVTSAAASVIVVADGHPNGGQQNTVAGMNWAVQKLGPISYRVDAEVFRRRWPAGSPSQPPRQSWPTSVSSCRFNKDIYNLIVAPDCADW